MSAGPFPNGWGSNGNYIRVSPPSTTGSGNTSATYNGPLSTGNSGGVNYPPSQTDNTILNLMLLQQALAALKPQPIPQQPPSPVAPVQPQTPTTTAGVKTAATPQVTTISGTTAANPQGASGTAMCANPAANVSN